MTALTTLESADLLLASIALQMLLGAVVVLLTSIGALIALGIVSVPATGTIGYALFFSPPEPSE